MMVTNHEGEQATVDRLKPGRFIWVNGDDDVAIVSTVDDDAFTAIMLGSAPVTPGVMEGSDIDQVTLISSLTVFTIAEQLYRKHPQLRRHRWAKLSRRAALPYSYQLIVGCLAGSDWPASFFCEAIGYGGNPKDVQETTPRWRGVRAAAREAMKECRKATDPIADFDKEVALRLNAQAEVSQLKRQIDQLKAKRKARKR